MTIQTNIKLINRKTFFMLFLVAIVFFIRGLYTAYFSDDLLYSLYLDKEAAHFGSDFTPIYFSNIWEIIPSQWNHYLYTNGRAICHVLVQLFNAFLPQWCYALFLAICNVLLVNLCVVIAKVPHNYKSYLFAILFTWIAFPQYITPCVGFGYTFSAVLILFWIYIFRSLHTNSNPISKKRLIFLFVFSIVCGSTNESLTIGIAGPTIIYLLFNYKKISKEERLYILGFFIGLCFLCFAPGSLRRFLWNSNNTFDFQVLLSNKISTLFNILKNLTIFYIWGVLYISTRSKQYYKYIKDNIYYILSILTTFCFCIAVGYINPRQLYLVELFSTILALRILMDVKIKKIIIEILSILLFLHLSYVTIFSIKIFKYNNHIISQYIDSKTGIVNVNKINVPVIVRQYVSELKGNESDWWYSYCLKKYYNKDTDLIIKY